VLLRLINGTSFELALEWRRGERSVWALACSGICIQAMVELQATWAWLLVLPLIIIGCAKAIRADLYPTHVFPRRIAVARVLGRIVRAVLKPPVKPQPTNPDFPSESN
jgi:hypothetical protein